MKDSVEYMYVSEWVSKACWHVTIGKANLPQYGMVAEWWRDRGSRGAIDQYKIDIRLEYYWREI